MLHKNILSKILTLSALLLGTTLATSSFAMDEPPQDATPVRKNLHVSKIDTLQNFAQPSEGDLIWMNVGHGLVHSTTQLRRENTKEDLLRQFSLFAQDVAAINPEDANNLTCKVKLASGKEFIQPGEKGLAVLFNDVFSKRGVKVVLATSRGDDGAVDTHSRTERELTTLGYRWKEWGGFVPVQAPEKKVVFTHDKFPGTIYEGRNNIIYHKSGKADPTVSLLGVIEACKSAGSLPKAIYCVTRPDTIAKVSKGLVGIDLEIPVHLVEYTHPAITVASFEDLKEFSISRLGKENFEQNYEGLFHQVFNPSK
jgi:hypothetical protein